MHKINFKTLKIVQKKIFEYDIDHIYNIKGFIPYFSSSPILLLSTPQSPKYNNTECHCEPDKGGRGNL